MPDKSPATVPKGALPQGPVDAPDPEFVIPGPIPFATPDPEFQTESGSDPEFEAVEVDPYLQQGGPLTVDQLKKDTGIMELVGRPSQAMEAMIMAPDNKLDVAKSQLGGPGVHKAFPPYEEMTMKFMDDIQLAFPDMSEELKQKGAKAAAFAMRAVLDPLNLAGAGIGAGAKGAKAAWSASTAAEALDIAKGLKGGAEAAPAAPDFGMINNLIVKAFGPDKETVKHYMADPELYTHATNVYTVKKDIDQEVKKLGIILSDKQSKLAVAEREVDDAFEIARQQYAQAPKPDELKPQVQESLKNLRKEISHLSGQAFDIAEESGVTIPRREAQLALKEAIESRFTIAKVTPEAQAAKARLVQIFKNMKSLPEQMSGSQVKELIRELDDATEYAEKAGAYIGAEDKIMQRLRGFLDSHLKDDDDYKAIMSQISADVKLQNKAVKAFGEESSLTGRLFQATNDKGDYYRGILKELGERTNNPFGAHIDNYRGAQSVLKNKNGLQQLREQLPEYQQYLKIKEDLDLANETVTRFTKRLGPLQTEGVVKALMNPTAGVDRYAEQFDAVNDLDRMRGTDFAKKILQLRVKAGFTKAKPMGSANTNLGGDAGEFVGSLLEGAVPGGRQIGRAARAGGSLLGRIADKEGAGTYVKSIMDAEIARKQAAEAALTVGASGARIGGIKGVLARLVGGGMEQAFLKYPGLTNQIIQAAQGQQPTLTVSDPNSLREAVSVIASSDLDSIERARLLTKIAQEQKLDLEFSYPPPPAPEPAPRPDLKEILKKTMGG